MQNMARELRETELETIAGGNLWDSIAGSFRGPLGGAGDLRRPLDRP
ncbi:hypothetical protein ACTGJ9_004675 [Bradyrhizobium sp. RDM12]